MTSLLEDGFIESWESSPSKKNTSEIDKHILDRQTHTR